MTITVTLPPIAPSMTGLLLPLDDDCVTALVGVGVGRSVGLGDRTFLFGAAVGVLWSTGDAVGMGDSIGVLIGDSVGN
jgi:hypothetical protein